MSISMIIALPIGNALRVFLAPPAGSTRTKILRKVTSAFIGINDPDAALVLDAAAGDAPNALDLVPANNVTYWYRTYDLVGGTWVAGDVVSAQAGATYGDASVDPLTVVIDRLAAGLAVEVQRRALVPDSDTGRVAVLSAPPTYEDTRWPMVTVHLKSDAAGERFLGETFGRPERDDSSWSETEGWLSRHDLEIVGWADNPDARIDLRKALKRVLIGNLPVFDSFGMVNVDLRFSDSEDYSYPAPVYQVMCSLSCQAPSAVSSEVDAIDDVRVVANAEEEVS